MILVRNKGFVLFGIDYLKLNYLSKGFGWNKFARSLFIYENSKRSLENSR